MKLFSVRDVKSETFGAPMALVSEGIAKRAFAESASQKSGDLSMYPNDFQLYLVGDWDPVSGRVTPEEPTPKYVISAAEAKAALAAARRQLEPELPGVEAK